ncbi:MAG: decaprenyl-phosphate phosphoribosyltransferase, partial [Ectothiorhodospiraceae bacterium]|nr:decaprenyl-phosphate phosphoribosyltransferase [Ectothiorhodospiraceae bacterium]
MISAIFQTMRPKHWTKNLFVLAPLLFSQHLFELSNILYAVAGFFLFSFISSSIYLLNDAIDAESDKLHPVKKHRPIAAGVLPKSIAYISSIVLAGVTLGTAFITKTEFGYVLAGYFSLNVLYTLYLKKAVIVDVMTIAISFLLRIIAGAVIIAVPISEWLLICGSLLALFLGFSKRRHEISVMDEEASKHRPVLNEYNIGFLDQMISLVTASTLISYMLYTVDEDTVARFGSKYLIATVPFVLYGLFRYLYVLHLHELGGSPTRALLTD